MEDARSGFCWRDSLVRRFIFSSSSLVRRDECAMNFIVEGREWLMLSAELFICYMLVLEYRYDERKDLAKKQRQTRTTKKTTTDKTGIVTTEETNETLEPINEEKK